ncbi:MAG TPA: gliding motility-associated C-terminal domain-containing protein [Flavobacteriales bacterium]
MKHLLILSCCAAVFDAYGQCGAVISGFPYDEGFEAAPAWTSGGNASDWAWGTPAHALINSAGGGSKSWCVGGLTGAYYNAGQLSWLESPCFDFTALEHPWISFKLFWETERQYDGMVLQYSLDGGSTYANVGAFGDTDDCLTSNWYNASYISNLTSASPANGWSGRVGATVGSCMGGEGSAEWLTASHCMSELGGEASVRFRFLFGAGTQCNNYDGIAVDDIHISEALPEVPTILTDCVEGSQMNFALSAGQCPPAVLWNFDDPFTGAANTSTSAFPQHTFSTPGTFNVTATVSAPCSDPVVISLEVHVLQVSMAAVPPTCGQANGVLTAQPLEELSGAVYTWSPGGATGIVLEDVAAGTYTVEMSLEGTCPASITFELEDQGQSPDLAISLTNISCAGLSDGQVALSATGGAVPYHFFWAGEQLLDPLVTDLPAGTYTARVLDAMGCSDEVEVEVSQPEVLTAVPPDPITTCPGDPVLLEVAISGGTTPYSVLWLPDGPAVAPDFSTTYTANVVDANGCTTDPAEAVVNVEQTAVPVITAVEQEGCAPFCTVLSVETEGDVVWQLSDGSVWQGASISPCFQGTGWYGASVEVLGASGCAAGAQADSLVHVLRTPQASFTLDPAITTIDHPLVTAWDASTDADRWSWSVGDPVVRTDTVRSPSFLLDSIACYPVLLQVASIEGCIDSSAASICVEPPFTLFVPNAFTPDGDGSNEVFVPIHSVREPREYRWMIFDRWGSVLFETTTSGAGWDGGAQVEGVYVWKLWIRDTEGQRHERVGHVALIR